MSAKNKFSYILNNILRVLEKTRLHCDFDSSIKNENTFRAILPKPVENEKTKRFTAILWVC